MWITTTTLLGLFSGWFTLMRRFPDRPETPILELNGISGKMGIGVNMKGILKLSACQSGLRISIPRVFGPFQRDFFVPWEEISSSRNKSLFMGSILCMTFGNEGTLDIEAYVANKLGRAVPEKWMRFDNELELVEENSNKILKDIAFRWALKTALVGSIFTAFILFSNKINKEFTYSDILIFYLFISLVFGLMAFFEYRQQKK